jgi:signal transduction histidine kinase/CheY-like chemotaxis protein
MSRKKNLPENFSEAKKIINNNPLPSVFFGLDEKILFYNKTFKSENKNVKVKGQNAFSFFSIPPDNTKRISPGNPYRFVNRDNTEYIISPFLEGKKKVGYFLFYHSRLNPELEESILQSQKMETIGKLASGMAHDFNNLLSSIFGSLNLLKRKLANRDDVKYLVENIESCSIRATDLTKGLLNYGKPTPRRKTPVNPAALLNELLRVVTETFPEQIQITSDISSGIQNIMGNSTEIYQVLLNLCINAKEAIKNNGRITVEARNILIDAGNQPQLPLLAPGNYVRFSVIDTGEGISEQNLKKIFEPYFSTKKKDTGSGLGLYVTYGIVKAHNGHIDIISKPGEGTRFDIYIPSYEEPSEEIKSTAEKIIVLADDEIMLRDLLAELLESYDYEVVCVQNGAEVYKVLTEEIKADLLIIDFNMPEMDGLTCIKNLRKTNVKTKTILSTGSATAANDAEISNLQIDAVLTKPYEFEQMLEVVRKLI